MGDDAREPRSQLYHSLGLSLSGNPCYYGSLPTIDHRSSNNHGVEHGLPPSPRHCEAVHPSGIGINIDPKPAHSRSYHSVSLPKNHHPNHLLSTSDDHSSNSHGGGDGSCPPSSHNCEPFHPSASDINIDIDPVDPAHPQSYRSLSLPGNYSSYQLLSTTDDHNSSSQGGGYCIPPSFLHRRPIHPGTSDIDPDPTLSPSDRSLRLPGNHPSSSDINPNQPARSQLHRSLRLPGIPSDHLSSTNDDHDSSNNCGSGHGNPPSLGHCNLIQPSGFNIDSDPACSQSHFSPSFPGNPSDHLVSTNDEHGSNNRGGGHRNPPSFHHCESIHTSASDIDPNSNSNPKKRISVPIMWSRMLVPKALYQVRPQAYSPQNLVIGPMGNSAFRGAFLMHQCKARCLQEFVARCKAPFDLDRITDTLFHGDQKPKAKAKAKAKVGDPRIKNLERRIALDSIFVLDFVMHFKEFNVWSKYFSAVTLDHMKRDLFMLQNQVPLTFLISLTRYQGLNEKDLFSALRRMIWDYSPFTSPNNAYINPSFKLPLSDSSPNKAYINPDFELLLSDTSLIEGQYEHLLHCLYQACIMKPKKEEQEIPITTSPNVKKPNSKPIPDLKPGDRIPRVSELCKVGVKFEAVDGTATAIDYNTKNLIVKLPKLVVDDGTECKLRNLVAYELTSQCNDDWDICTYVMLMDSLIDKTDDLDILYKADVLHNHLGSDEKLINMWNEMRANIQLPISDKQKKLTLAIITPYRTWWRKIYVEFQRRFFSRPWYTMSTLAALLLLLMTALQTFYSVMGTNKI